MTIIEYEDQLTKLGFPAGNAGWIVLNGQDKLVYRVKKGDNIHHFYLSPADKMTAQQRADQIEAIKTQLSD